ncbi:hypothetical protein V2J94_00975 [Streptomyces sp. DSM 41524]|uniref:Uncharacterized protein n=1 Tax=Streptomyces asiaticus subsp. ignotus TaxID=3098222 RepID=A0ABU7PN58_9ACTN|nr:hypothetical protein [Streptomyces sp. DSM 41524]
MSAAGRRGPLAEVADERIFEATVGALISAIEKRAETLRGA